LVPGQAWELVPGQVRELVPGQVRELVWIRLQVRVGMRVSPWEQHSLQLVLEVKQSQLVLVQARVLMVMYFRVQTPPELVQDVLVDGP
jgi:hypothetical protein